MPDTQIFRRALLLPCLLAFLALPSANIARAQEADEELPPPIGHAVLISGDPMIHHKGEEMPVLIEPDSAIYPNDTIFTDAASAVKIEFIDHTSISLAGEDGSLEINSYIFDPALTEKNQAHYTILKASFEYISGLIDKRIKPERTAGTSAPNVKIDLDLGSIGVRGTTLYRSMKEGQCWVYLENGLIDVYNEGGKVTLTPGQGTRMSARDKAPLTPAPWKKERIDWIKGTLSALDKAPAPDNDEAE